MNIIKYLSIASALILSNCASKESSIATKIDYAIGSSNNAIFCQRADEVIDYNDKSCYRVEKETGPVIVKSISPEIKKVEKPVVVAKKAVKSVQKKKKTISEICTSNGFKKTTK